MNPKNQVNKDKPLENGNGALHIVLPGYRGPFAANDFIDLNVRLVDDAITGYLGRHLNRLPWNPPRELVFHLATENRDSRKEATTRSAYSDLFRYHAATYWRHFTEQIPMFTTLAAVGMFMLWLSNYVGDTKLPEDVKSTLSDIVQVGAWVAMWTAIAGLFSEGFLSLLKYFAFRRLGSTKMSFDYSCEGTMADSDNSGRLAN